MRKNPSIVVIFVTCLLAAAAPAGALVFFSHDVPGVGLPGSAVDVLPDAGDIFVANVTMCGAAFPLGNNGVHQDKVADLGLLAGDNIDALSVRHTIPAVAWRTWRFSVMDGSGGVTFSAVSAGVPFNAADIFWTAGLGSNVFCTWEWQLGLAGDDEMDGLEEFPENPAIFFSLAPGSPSLVALGATPGDILGVVPGGGPPVIAFPHNFFGLTPTDDVDAFTLATIPGVTADAVFFSVVKGAAGLPGTAVAVSPDNGADIFYSPMDGSNYANLAASDIGLLVDDELDGLTPDETSTVPPPAPITVDCDYSVTPPTGVVPFVTTHDVMIGNVYPLQVRRMAARIDVTLANGSFIPNWQSGYTNIAPLGSFVTSFPATIPAAGAVIGTNTFELVVEDVTPMPFNQPPYPASGDTCRKQQQVVAVP